VQLTEDEKPQPDPISRLWWSVPAAAFLLLMVLASLFGGENEPIGRGTSYDASNSGFRAAYLLLEELGYPVERSKRPTGGAARLVLAPEESAKEAQELLGWVADGGVIVLGDDSKTFAGDMSVVLDVKKLEPDPGEQPATGVAGVAHLAGGNVRVSWPGGEGRVWARIGDEPAITVYSHGLGEIWLLNAPGLFTNKHLREADNAILLCRLVDALLTNRTGVIAFDEVVHGMRERPGVVELLLRPPATWMTLQCLLLMAVLLWHYMPRFGALRQVNQASRRSKAEFLDAMASLLDRKADYGEAYRTARQDLAREIERELGLPSAAPPQVIAREAARRRPVKEDVLCRLLATDSLPVAGAAGKSTFVKLMNELETARDEFFARR
jgi:Domain of unknown function (DUF4350)